MARAMHRRCCCPPESDRPLCFSLSFTSSHRAAPAQGFFHQVVHVALEAVDARAPGDVLVDALGEGVGLLEDHADAAAHFHRVDVRGVEVLAVEEDLALGMGGRAPDRSCG